MNLSIRAPCFAEKQVASSSRPQECATGIPPALEHGQDGHGIGSGSGDRRAANT